MNSLKSVQRPAFVARLGESLPVSGLLHLLVVYLVWGSTYLAIRIAVQGPHGFPPFLLGALRLLPGGLLLLAWAAFKRRPIRLTRQQLLWAALSGTLLWVGGNGLVMVAEQHAASGYSALMMGMVPIWVAVLELKARHRLPSKLLVVGLTLGLMGLAVLTYPTIQGGSPTGVGGVVALLGASLCWASGLVLQRRRLQDIDAVVSSAWQQLMAGSVFLLLAMSLRQGWPTPSVSALGALTYLLVVGSLLAFTSFIVATRLLATTVVTTYSYVNPLVAVLLGALVLGEPITWYTVLGGALLLMGVGSVIRSHTRSRPPKPGHNLVEASTAQQA